MIGCRTHFPTLPSSEERDSRAKSREPEAEAARGHLQFGFDFPVAMKLAKALPISTVVYTLVPVFIIFILTMTYCFA